MAANTIASDVDSNRELTIAVTEVWPDQFELTVDADSREMPVTTTYTLNRGQLQVLRQRIGEALR